MSIGLNDRQMWAMIWSANQVDKRNGSREANLSLHHVVLTAILTTALLTACDPLNPNLPDVVGQLQSEIQNFQLQSPPMDSLTEKRAAALHRAAQWIDPPVPYSQNGMKDHYRTDCSGFVSYAYQLVDLQGQPYSFDTTTISSTFFKHIKFSELQPGDIINNDARGNDGHAMLFVKWEDAAHLTFTAYEENNNPDGNVATDDGRALISKYTFLNSNNSSRPIRYLEDYNGFYPERIVNP